MGREQLTRLFRQVGEDGGGLEDGLAAIHALLVDDGGDLVVGTYGQELGAELLVLADVHRYGGVGQPGFLEHN